MRLLLWFVIFFSLSFPILAQNAGQHDPLVDPFGHYPVFANSVEILSLTDSTRGAADFVPVQRIVDLNSSGELAGSSPYVPNSGYKGLIKNLWYDCITGDFDGDGIDEILTAWVATDGYMRMEISSAARLKPTYNYQWSQRIYGGDSTWGCQAPIRILAVNLDSTARKEIVICTPLDSLYPVLKIDNCYFNDSDKTFRMGNSTFISAGLPYDIAAGNFSGQGIDGLIIVYRGESGTSFGMESYYYNPANKSFSLSEGLSVPTTDAQWSTWKRLKITAGDFRNHGYDEAVVSLTLANGNNGRQVFCYIPINGGLLGWPSLPGSSPTGWTWGSGWESDAVAVDLNPAKNDGDELVVAGPGEVAVLRFDASLSPYYCGSGAAKTPFLNSSILETYPRRH
jgi:hypothetical protein